MWLEPTILHNVARTHNDVFFGDVNHHHKNKTPQQLIHLKEKLLQKYPQLENIHSYAIAVNENYASEETTLKEKDVIAIIPPVSGG